MSEHTVATAGTVLRVSATSTPQAVAAAIAKAISEGNYPTLRAIGHGAVGQMYKALAVARGYVAPHGIDLAFIPGFEMIKGDGDKEISAMTAKTISR